VAVVASAVAAGIVLARGVIWPPPGNARASEATPTLAVGVIRDEIPDSARLGGVLTDMLSTNLARVNGLRVVGNTRILALIPQRQDTSAAAYSDAARRAGATELLEGRVVDDARDAFTIELRRVDLRSGLLKGAYRASATSRFRLVDSMTAMVAHDLQLAEPVAPLNDVTTRSATAFRLYQEGLRAYYQFDFPIARQMMRAALDDDSTFAMAAYYDALLTDSPQSSVPSERAIRLAERASERGRLVIRVDLMSRGALASPLSSAIADTLATRYPNDPRALEAVARARGSIGDWRAAASALQRAISIDSAALGPRTPCYLCEDLNALIDLYFWWDSLPAAARVARQYVRLRPDWPRSWELTFLVAAKMGDTAAARRAFGRYTALHPNPRSTGYETKMNLLLDLYDNVEGDLRPLFESPKLNDYNDSRWFLLIALRNQGRLREARLLNETGTFRGFAPPRASPISPEAINVGLLALESGNARAAAAAFTRSWQSTDGSGMAPGTEARYRAWRATLAGMAIAATGDTAAVLRMADTVQYWGQRSVFGRDQKAHHYLRGMVHVARGRDEDAIREFRQAIYSYTLGFTRVNLELGRALLRRDRPREAVAVVAPALRGEIDASNLYVTRTELHELLAQAFDGVGESDSAAVHYRVVARAWANADDAFHARRDAARGWLARYAARGGRS
jgi:tetratricopeptide (TPR) repeat protein